MDKTPFTMEPMQTSLGFHAETSFANLLRSGEADFDDLEIDDDTRTFLKELMPSPLDPQQISTTLHTRDVMKAHRAWLEMTMTSPLGRHLGMHKVWLKASDDKDMLNGEEFFQIITRIMQIAIRHSCPLKRWTVIHNLFLMKDPGSPKITRL